MAVALVGDHAFGAVLRTAVSCSLHPAFIFHQGLEQLRLVTLSGRKDEGKRFAAAFCPDVELGGEPASAPAQRLAFLTASRASGVLVGAHGAAIDEMPGPIEDAALVGVSP